MHFGGLDCRDFEYSSLEISEKLTTYDQFHWAMIRAKDLGMDACALQFVLQSFAYDEVIYAPTSVLLSCMKAIRPPRINIGFIGIKIAERVDET